MSKNRFNSFNENALKEFRSFKKKMNYLVVAICAAVIFLLFKITERRFSKSETKPAVKFIVRDSVLVFAGAAIAFFLSEQATTLAATTSAIAQDVFTDPPF